MSTERPNGSGTLASVPEAPPPGPELLAAVGSMQGVRTRVPARTLAAIGAAALVVPIVTLVRFGARRDLAALPAPWVLAMAVAWTAGLLLTLVPAILPRRGEVLPDTGRAGRLAAITGIGLLLLGLLGAVDAPGHTRIPETTWGAFGHFWWHCTSFGLQVIAPVLLVSAIALRRVFPVGGWRAGAALGAAGGAAAGLALLFTCGIGGALHMGFAHAGAVAIGALLGGLLLGRPLRA
jgi:hypothetical protein